MNSIPNDYILKTLITSENYEKIVSQFNLFKYDIQTNYYYDTDIFILKESNCSLRVRQQNDKYVLLFRRKRKYDKFDDYQEEITKEIFETLNQTQVLPDISIKKEIQSMTKLYQLVNYLSIKTTRIRAKYKECLIFIDKTEYLDCIDYEIELHSEGRTSQTETDAIFNRLLKKYSITYKTAQKKIDRAYTRLNG